MREAGADPDKFNIEKCSGAAECKKALTLLKVGKLPADFIEGMVCEGGCVGGPSRHRSGRILFLLPRTVTSCSPKQTTVMFQTT